MFTEYLGDVANYQTIYIILSSKFLSVSPHGFWIL